MKQIKHQDRKSFRKWALPNQRVETAIAEKLGDRRVLSRLKGRNWENIGRNRGQIPMPHAQIAGKQFQLHRHSIVKDPCGPKAKVIQSYDYRPTPKAPSYLDLRRMRRRGMSV